MLLKDILDDWVRSKPEGKKYTRAGEARRKEAIGQQQECRCTPTHTCNMCFNFSSASEGKELLEPFQFISDVAVEAAFDVIAGLLASFGCIQPNMMKYKVSCSALECFGPNRSEMFNL